jgi:lipid A oxidase
MSRSLQVLALAGLCAFSLPAAAETQISAFGGVNTNFSSDAKLRNAPGVPDETRNLEWDGGSFELPPYWGVRATYWLSSAQTSGWGFALEYSHTKAIANLNFATDPTYTRLEFTDGNNLVLLEALYRFQPWMNGKVVPYVGAGIGVAIPHTEVTLRATGDKTFEYQCCSLAAQIQAGLEYKLNEKWSMFVEGKLSYSHIDASLNGGGSFETDLWTPQLALGLSYRF